MVEMQKERERTGGDPYSKVGQKYSEKQMTERQKLFEEIKKHNQGNGTPTKLKNPTKNEPWILRNTIIWHKPNCMPSSAKDRFTVDFEKIFFFVKNKKYWFNQQFEPYTEPMNHWGGEKLVASGESSWDNGTGQTTYRDRDMRPNPEGRNKRAVWSVNTKPYSGAHFATFPEKLIEPMVLAGCPEGGVVLDPFFGSGTTGVVAIRNRRNYIGIELNPEYIKLANDRIQSIEQNLF
jgi:site-specific DNA-methyltransferase (adenine-specific)